MVGKTLAEPLAELRATRAYIGEKIAPRDHLLHRECRGAGERVRHIGEAMLEGAGPLGKRPEDAL
jgi:hypothetical protein